MADELVNVTIDGMQLSVPKGTSIIEAAKQAGVLVPHYCYHPSLPSPAVCRMCLVEVEKAPKLMPACVTTVTEGQVVHVNSPGAKKAREGVLELLLDLSDNMTGKTICVLSDSCAAPVVSGIQKFRSEFEAYIAGARAPAMVAV